MFTEVKTENALDRITSEANPRPIERVPAGAVFTFSLVLDIFDAADHDLFRDLFAAMHLLENSSLGGSGSRGHGQIAFQALKLNWRSLDYYRKGQAEAPVVLPGGKMEDLVKGFEKITWPG